jgi:hypothetical protein
MHVVYIFVNVQLVSNNHVNITALLFIIHEIADAAPARYAICIFVIF